MEQSDLFGKDLICTQDWTKHELDLVLDLAGRMKRERYSYNTILQDKTFFMFFYNPSVRTRQSFEVAATELGGHAQFLEPKAMRLKTSQTTEIQELEQLLPIDSTGGCSGQLGVCLTNDSCEFILGVGNLGSVESEIAKARKNIESSEKK